VSFYSATVAAPAPAWRSGVTDRLDFGSSRSPYQENPVDLRLPFGNLLNLHGFRTRQTLSIYHFGVCDQSERFSEMENHPDDEMFVEII
jgi:hypothetical protein